MNGTLNGSMRAVMIRGPREVELVEVPVPSPGPGEVLLRVEAALTCGTDAKVYRRGYHARMISPPAIFGHEYSGVIEELGEGVEGWAVGDEVVGANSAPCGNCEYCGRGRQALCDDLLFVNGAFAQWMVLPPRLVRSNLHHRPPGIDPKIAAATEPVACVLKAIEDVAPSPGDTALVLGAGPISCLLVAELRAREVRTVVYSRSPGGTHYVGRSDPDVVVESPEISEPEARRLLLDASGFPDGSHNGRGYDLVVEAAGSRGTSEASVKLCRKGGKVLLFGGCASDARITVEPARLHYEEISILSSFHHTPRHVRASLDALASGRIPIDPLLEEPVGLDGVGGALEGMCRRLLRGKVPVIP